jgi:hypothetical protein
MQVAITPFVERAAHNPAWRTWDELLAWRPGNFAAHNSAKTTLYKPMADLAGG